MPVAEVACCSETSYSDEANNTCPEQWRTIVDFLDVHPKDCSDESKRQVDNRENRQQRGSLRFLLHDRRIL